MSRIRKHQENKLICGILAIMLLSLLLLSSFYIAAESQHECHGEDCAVCACIELCDVILHTVHTVIILLAAISIILVIPHIPSSAMLLFRHATLVTQKIRLNN